MTIFLAMLVIFGLLHLPPFGGWFKTARAKGRVTAGGLFILAGTLHFLIPEKFLMTLPPELSWGPFLVYSSGLLEILGGIGLLTRFREGAAYGLAALLVAVFPANVYVALNNVPLGGWMSEPLYQWIRLPFQAVFIAWVLWCRKD